MKLGGEAPCSERQTNRLAHSTNSLLTLHHIIIIIITSAVHLPQQPHQLLMLAQTGKYDQSE